MSSPVSGTLAGLYRHPVKGFSPEPLTAVALAPGQGFLFDRVWAVENGPSGFDPEAPGFIPKQKFTVLASLPRVAAAKTRYDEESETFHASAEGLPAFAGRLDNPEGREAFAGWLGELLGDEARGPLKVLQAPAIHRFTDHPQGQVSLVNLASVRDLSRRMGVEVDPLRFRANLYLDGVEPWAELGWMDKKIGVGGARLAVFARTTRCEATNVDPMRGVRDMAVPAHLQRTWGHHDFGIYAKVVVGGEVAVASPVAPPQ